MERGIVDVDELLCGSGYKLTNSVFMYIHAEWFASDS